MRSYRNTDVFSLPWLVVAFTVVLLFFGAIFALMGAWSLLHPRQPPEPGWPFVVSGCLAMCFAWASLLRRHRLLAIAPFTILCLLTIGGGLAVAWRQHRKITGYVPVEAWVLSAAVEYRAVEHEDSREDFYAPAVYYQYAVAGQVYSGDTPYPMPRSFVAPSGERGPAREVLDVIAPELPAGVDRIGETMAEADRARALAVEAYYNPRDPADSFLIKRYAWPPFAMVLGPAVPLWAIGFLLVKWSSFDDRRHHAVQWLLVAAWHVIGLWTAGYCFAIVFRAWGMLGPLPAAIVGVYELAGLIPLTVMLPQEGWPGRIKAVLSAGGTAGLVAGLLSLPVAAAVGAAVELVAALAFHKSLGVFVWVVAAVLVATCSAAVIAGGAALVAGGESSSKNRRHVLLRLL